MLSARFLTVENCVRRSGKTQAPLAHFRRRAVSTADCQVAAVAELEADERRRDAMASRARERVAEQRRTAAGEEEWARAETAKLAEIRRLRAKLRAQQVRVMTFHTLRDTKCV